MKTKTVKLNDIQLKIVKSSLELLLLNADWELPCIPCQKRLLKLIDTFSELTEGITLTEKIRRSKLN